MQLGALEYIISIKDGGIESQINKAEKKVKGFGDRLSAFTIAKGQLIGNFATKALQSTARLAKQTFSETVSQFGKFEQLSEGAALLFGKGFDFISDKAENAFKNVQISMNEYLEQANAYATGLKVSLNGDELAAAQLSDRIITAQADIVAATGASREAVENGFKGLLRGNFTMLDNLQLGIKGTKAGMKEVIDRVNEWHKANKRATKYEMDNLADMNNALIDYVEMQGLAGYASKEATDTLEGSMSSAKAAWKDLMTNIGRGKDIKKAAKNFGEAARKALTNLRPVIKESVTGIFTAFKELLPEMGNILEDLKKDLNESDIPIFRVLGEAIDKVELAWNGLNALIDDFPNTVKKLQESDDPFAKALGGALETGKQIFEWILDKAGSVEGAITGIAAAFALIKIAPGVSTFVANLLKIGALGGTALSKMFGIGNTPTPTTPTPTTETPGTPKTGNGGWEKIKQDLINHTNSFNLTNSAVVSDWFTHNTAIGRQLTNFIQGSILGGQKPFADEGIFDGLEENVESFGKDWSNNALVKPVIDGYKNAINFWQDFWNNNTAKIEIKPEDLVPMDEQTLQLELMEKIRQGGGLKAPVEAETDTKPVEDAVNQLDLSAKVNLVPDFSTFAFTGGNGNGAGGGGKNVLMKHAKGLWQVPRDNYHALLHRDEMVLTKSQARKLRDGEYSEPGMSGTELLEAIRQIKILMNGDKVADLTTKRTRKNINAQSYSRVRAYGGA